MELQTGALLWMGIKGYQLESSEKQFIEKESVSGLILFKRNVASLAQLYELCREIHSLKSSPLIAMDREGGGVDRLQHLKEMPCWPAPEDLAQNSVQDIQYSSFLMGQEMRALGIDINLAPALDIKWTSSALFKNRLFGTHASEVIKKGTAFLSGLKQAGLLACAKHFPGHGGVLEDSHKTLPVDKRLLQELRPDLQVFHFFIKKLPFIMTAHVLYPHWDAQYPATLSPIILTKYLREYMGFSGFILSDDLDMQALSCIPYLNRFASFGAKFPKHVVIPLLALRSGVDILLQCHDSPFIYEWPRLFRQALKEGLLSPQKIKSQIQRIKKFQAHYKKSSVHSAHWSQLLSAVEKSQIWCEKLHARLKNF